MFAGQECFEHHRKRGREEDYADISVGGTLGFTEHRSKRIQSLPLRTSPTSKRWAEPPNFPPSNPMFAMPGPPRTMTPISSDAEEPALEEHVWADEPELIPQKSSTVTVSEISDGDMDMMDTSEPVGSGPGNPTAPNNTGRIPTPIHCSFAAQVRGNSWNDACVTLRRGPTLATTPEEPNAMAFNSNGAVDITGQNATMTDRESVPRFLDGAAATAEVMSDWNMVQHRRLPSPISECGGEDSLGSPGMVLDSSPQRGGRLSQVTHQHPLLAGLPPRASSAMEGGQFARNGSPGRDSQNSNAMDVESPATPSPKKGHTRSRHTLNSWTALQPGMTRSFSIGYRADCEKCQKKVPGHFNHIIIS
ncbi:hypothetical protein MMYC01_210212 [Madurella mycetomatis]|uniref:Uncharacterized protein n=1 Tax=Madurella mycetomatis TaxID=100816 RepID=A0A175VP18_9PEZI|nr:hypothetical protein MMYC01_210212 [Madurella mycetomatis]